MSVIKNDGGVCDTAGDDTEDTFAPQDIWGWTNFISRSKILKESNHILNDGTLTFFIRIKPNKKHYCLLTKSQPELTLSHNISKLLGDNNTADLAFKVGNSVFYVHQLILNVQAPELFELAEQFNTDNPMAIKDVDPDIFEMMLGHVYGKRIYSDKWKNHDKAILIASGKYGFTALKSEAEAWRVKNLNLTIDNAVDELLYADATHCLDLKKASIKFIVENGEEVLASTSSAKLYESPELMKNVMMELAKSNSTKKRKLDELSPSS